ncbi:MAG: hypothetical protein RR975_04960 [Clostridia bacterium]
MLGNETIYQWCVGDAQPQVYWQQIGIVNYRHQETAPEDESEHILWQKAISYLTTDGASLYAWQPHSGHLFRVQGEALTLVASVPLCVLSYVSDGQTVYRELRQVAMQGNRLYLLLGTDDPSDWEKTTLLCLDKQTEQMTVLSTENIKKFVIVNENALIVSLYDREKNLNAFHLLSAANGELQSPFLSLAGNQPVGDMSFWKEHLLLCTSGQITGYDRMGASNVMAYAPISAYGNSKTACNESGVCAAADGGYVFIRDLTQQPQMTVLHIMGNVEPNTFIRFSLLNPDIAIVTLPQRAEEAIQQSALSSNGDVDLYVVEAPGIYAQLKVKGYLAPLNASNEVVERARLLYPCIQETLMAGERLMAYPIGMSTESWTQNQTLWERFALGEVPKTYAELLDLMERWHNDYWEENPDYSLVDLFDGASGCIKLLVKEYLLQCGSEYPDFTRKDFRDAMLDIIAHQDLLNASAETNGMPIVYTYYQGFGIGYNDDEQTRMMLMPAIHDTETQKLSGTLTLLTMSSACTQQEAALRFIAFCAEHVDMQTQYMMNPTLNTPLRRDNHNERLAELYEEKAALGTRLTAADDTAALELKDTIAQKDAQIASVKEDWLISSESINNYRSVAQQLEIPYDTPFFGASAGFNALEMVIDTACEQKLSETTLDSLLENLNRVARMVMLENE